MFLQKPRARRWLSESGKLGKFSLINAPRVSIVVNGGEMEQGKWFESGHYCGTNNWSLNSACVPFAFTFFSFEEIHLNG